MCIGKTQENASQKAQQLLAPLLPVVETITKQLLELLENEAASSYGKGKYSGHALMQVVLLMATFEHLIRKILLMNSLH